MKSRKVEARRTIQRGLPKPHFGERKIEEES